MFCVVSFSSTTALSPGLELLAKPHAASARSLVNFFPSTPNFLLKKPTHRICSVSSPNGPQAKTRICPCCFRLRVLLLTVEKGFRPNRFSEVSAAATLWPAIAKHNTKTSALFTKCIYPPLTIYQRVTNAQAGGAAIKRSLANWLKHLRLKPSGVKRHLVGF